MSIQIALHLFSVLPALLIGCLVLVIKKGTRVHKMLGRIWVGLMLFTSLVSFFIRDEGKFSWIHILSIITIVSMGIAIWAIRHGRVRTHRGFMIGAFIGSIVAGVFASVLPGRLVYVFLFS